GNEMVRVRRTGGQVPAVAIELGAKRLGEVEEAVPRRLDVVAKSVGHFRIGLVHARGTDERRQKDSKADPPRLILRAWTPALACQAESGMNRCGCVVSFRRQRGAPV